MLLSRMFPHSYILIEVSYDKRYLTSDAIEIDNILLWIAHHLQFIFCCRYLLISTVLQYNNETEHNYLSSLSVLRNNHYVDSPVIIPQCFLYFPLNYNDLNVRKQIVTSCEKAFSVYKMFQNFDLNPFIIVLVKSVTMQMKSFSSKMVLLLKVVSAINSWNQPIFKL